jgi:23S rRNA (pseudouridine1915-N3)-methyltransferase
VSIDHRQNASVIELLCVGRPRGPLAEAAAEYEKMLSRFCTLRVREVREEALQHTTPAESLERERRRLEPLLGGAWVVALERDGRQLASEAFAAFVREREEQPPQHTLFLIGGPRGLAPELVAGARTTLSLGAATLPHQLARVVLVEQLFRAFKILRGEPYHL